MCELRKSDGNSSTSLHPDHSATAATSALGLRSPQPDLHLDSTHHPQNKISIGTELTPLASALRLGSSLPHLHRDSARCPPHLHRDWAHPPHICTWTGLAHATSAPGLPGLTPATSAPGLGSPGEKRSILTLHDGLALIQNSYVLRAELGELDFGLRPHERRVVAPWERLDVAAAMSAGMLHG